MKYFLLIPALIYMGCTKPPAAPPATDKSLPTIRCTERALPEFSLGEGSSPSEQEQVALCECIWSRLGDHDRKVATNLRNQRRVSASTMESFPPRFGKAIGTCTPASRYAASGATSPRPLTPNP